MHFPWGSLLRGVLGRDREALAGLASLLAPGAPGRALVSVVPRDGVPGLPSGAVLEAAYARHGLELLESRPAAPAEVAAARSSWAARLGAPERRPVTLVRFRARPRGSRSRGARRAGSPAGRGAPDPELAVPPGSQDR